ncbi:MAG TPA: radical SAM protein [Acidimicrobiia bacterium]|nr:radical SAM protein [Acidimicrobiia bacterium]
MTTTRVRWASSPPVSSAAQLALFPAEERVVGRGEFRGLEFVHVQARSIINRLPGTSPMPFRHTINAYRGCSHACTYCFARPTHAYLDLDPGTDFDRVIVVKVNAVERLRAELAPRRWAGDAVAMGTNTDPYQRAEGKYHLTRGIVEVLAEARNPFSILTKSTLILRDRDLLADAARRADVSLCFSVGTLDEDVWRLTEPGTPHPARRLEAVARLNEAGIRCSVLIGPVLPGLSDRPEQLDAVVRGAVDAGAASITSVLLHLRPGVRDHYLASLREHRPDLVADHEQLYARGAYAPTEHRERISRLVRDLVAHHRDPHPTRRNDASGRFSGP